METKSNRILIVHQDKDYYEKVLHEVRKDFEEHEIYYFDRIDNIPKDFDIPKLDIAILNNLDIEFDNVNEFICKIRNNSEYYTTIILSGSENWKENYKKLNKMSIYGIDGFSPYPFNKDILNFLISNFLTNHNYKRNLDISPEMHRALTKLLNVLEDGKNDYEARRNRTTSRSNKGITKLWKKIKGIFRL